MKFYGNVPGSTRKNFINYDVNLDLLRRVNEQGARNDPEPLTLACHQGPTFFNAYFYIVQYGGNGLPRPRRCALSECLVF